MEYNITDLTTLGEIKDILHKAKDPGDIITCENDFVFMTVVAFIDWDRKELLKKIREKGEQ